MQLEGLVFCCVLFSSSILTVLSKVYVENYMEGYHIPNMHPELNKMVNMNEYVVEVMK